jgi:S1-C subfamily serine protease
MDPQCPQAALVRDRSASSSRRSARLAAGCILLALAGGVSAQPALGSDLEVQLEGILRGAGPGVVKIDVRRPWGMDDPAPADRARNRHMPVRRIQGNGVVWDEIGHIVTVADLAQPGDTIRVFSPDGSMATGEFVGQDPDLGISVIHVHGMPSLRPLPRGAVLPKSPSWIFTISYPGVAHPQRTTPGLSVARTEKELSYAGRARGKLEGNGDPALAGGGVLDGDGKFVGLLLGEGSESLLLLDPRRMGPPVEYAIRSPGPSEAGWIVPVEQMEPAMGPLLNSHQRGTQGFLGVRVDVPSGSDRARSGPGVLIANVLPGSPAALAGLLPGDRLVGFDGAPVLSWDELTQRVAAIPPGQSVRVDLIRAGSGLALKIRIEDRAHSIWRQKQRQMTNGREKMLRHQMEGLRQQLELLRHQALSAH